MLALNFGTPALEELPVLHFFSTPSTCYLRCDSRVERETAVVDTGRRAVCCKSSLVRATAGIKVNLLCISFGLFFPFVIRTAYIQLYC